LQDARGGDSNNILEVRDVSKKYGKFSALSHLSINLARGSHLLLLGPNGAGKTTLIKCILGLAGFQGDIRVKGIRVKENSTLTKKLIGYVPQNYAFYENISVLDQAKMSCRLKDVAVIQAKEKLEMVGLWDVHDRKIRALSDGMKQRLGIGLALIGDPELLILDEPTSNIDLRGQLDFQDLIQRLLKMGKSFLTATHLTGLGELASEVLVIDKGRQIAMGDPSKLMQTVNVADTLYLRVDNGQVDEIAKLIKTFVSDEIHAKGSWLTVAIPNTLKLKLLKSLIDSGLQIDDLMIERTSIESEYLRLLGGN
jgi:ABC-type multidrug transport system ATPase subunit